MQFPVSLDVMQNLDETGVSKAAVETVAENFGDGVFAPMFYMALGSVCMYLYKAINTMDSMVGYKNERFLYFGRCAAKLDDVANFIPARLAGILLVISAWLGPFDGKNAGRISARDRHNHASPNSAHTEAAASGALDIQLAGNAYYFGKLYEKPFIGDPLRAVARDVHPPHEPTDVLGSFFIRCSAGCCQLLALLVKERQ